MSSGLPTRELEGFLARAIFGRADRRAAERADFIAKFDSYVSAVTNIAVAFEQTKSNVSRGLSGRFLDKVVRIADGLTSEAQDEMLARSVFRRRYRESEERQKAFVEARDRLVTISPRVVRDEINRIGGLLERWSDAPGPEFVGEWRERRAALQRAADLYLRPWWRRRPRRRELRRFQHP